MAERARALQVEKETMVQGVKQQALHEKLRVLREEHDAREAIRKAVLEEKEKKAQRLEEIRREESKILSEQKKRAVFAFQKEKADVIARDRQRLADAER